MSITDELRKWADTYLKSTMNDMLNNIAGHIDAEHEKAIRELNNLADAIDETCLFLPKDADGVPIHIGDELGGYGYPKGGAYCKAIVNKVMILAGPKDGSYRSWLMWDAAEVRHHHEPTVDDLLREYHERRVELGTPDDCIGVDREDAVRCILRDIDKLTDEYAAKLQLRGDGE